MKKMLGVCYYPEHWDKSMWQEDANLMSSLGIKLVRIGEFAWSRLEPVEGSYKWQWLDQVFECLSQAGLKIVLGTPSATPPSWMLRKFEDMLQVDRHGKTKKFGSRRHYSTSHPGYAGESARIAEALSKRYGSNDNLYAWQVDNEYGGHDTIDCFSLLSLKAFRNWLKEKYITIENLNLSWGNVFWSMEYPNFESIDFPIDTPTYVNPAHFMDYKRFSSMQLVKFNKLQIDAIKKYSKVPILHNYMGKFFDFDHFKLGDDLDIATWDNYPLGNLHLLSLDQKEINNYRQQGHPDLQSFHHSLYLNVGKGRMWVMEQQPGPVNWGVSNAAPLEGMVKLWTLEALAHGAEVVSYFRFRQLPFAQEQMHSGLLAPDNSKSPAWKEIESLSSEDWSTFSAKNELEEVGLVFDYESLWAWDIQPHTKEFNYFQLVFDFYSAFRKMGIGIDIISKSALKDKNITKNYKLILAPGIFCLDEEIKKNLDGIATQVVLGPRTNSKTIDFKIPLALPPNFEALKLKIYQIDALANGARINLAPKGSFIHWFEYCKVSKESVFYTTKGLPALTEYENISYLCGWPDSDFFDVLINYWAKKLGFDTFNLPEGLRIKRYGKNIFWFNYSNKTIEFNNHRFLPAAVKIDKI